MNESEYFKELNFLRERLWAIGSLLHTGENMNAAFTLGQIYECVRKRCEQLQHKTTEET